MADLETQTIPETQAEPALPPPRTLVEAVADMASEGLMDGRVLAVLADLQVRVTMLEAGSSAKAKTGATT